MVHSLLSQAWLRLVDVRGAKGLMGAIGGSPHLFGLSKQGGSCRGDYASLQRGLTRITTHLTVYTCKQIDCS